MKSSIRTLLTTLLFCCLALRAPAQDPGIKVSILVHDDGSKTVTKTDPESHTCEEQTLTEKDKLLKRVVFTVDENNRAISGVIFTPAGKPVRKIVYKYDGKNRVSEEQDFTPADVYLGKFVYEYNDNGKLVKVRAYDAAGNDVTSPGAKNSH